MEEIIQQIFSFTLESFKNTPGLVITASAAFLLSILNYLRLKESVHLSLLSEERAQRAEKRAIEAENRAIRIMSLEKKNNALRAFLKGKLAAFEVEHKTNLVKMGLSGSEEKHFKEYKEKLKVREEKFHQIVLNLEESYSKLESFDAQIEPERYEALLSDIYTFSDSAQKYSQILIGMLDEMSKLFGRLKLY